MSQHSANNFQDSKSYNADYLIWLFQESGKSLRMASRDSNTTAPTVAQALAGDCKKIDTLKRIVESLNGSMVDAVNLNLPKSQYRRAVRSGGAVKGRSALGSAGRSVTTHDGGT